jgi:hypothetical protein
VSVVAVPRWITQVSGRAPPVVVRIEASSASVSIIQKRGT